LLVKAKNWLIFMRIPVPSTVGVSNFVDPRPFPWIRAWIWIPIRRWIGTGEHQRCF
jgi:hypothetical protein